MRQRVPHSARSLSTTRTPKQWRRSQLAYHSHTIACPRNKPHPKEALLVHSAAAAKPQCHRAEPTLHREQTKTSGTAAEHAHSILPEPCLPSGATILTSPIGTARTSTSAKSVQHHYEKESAVKKKQPHENHPISFAFDTKKYNQNNPFKTTYGLCIKASRRWSFFHFYFF